MAQLELRFEKRNLGGDLKLGVVARIRQIKDANGQFPDEPQEREVVIPAGSYSTRTVDGLPPGTYRIEARLPSGQVLRETREVTDEQPATGVVFETEPSPHEWLSFQRLAGNVPSQAQYEDWVNKIAGQINEFAKAKADATKPIQIDEATIRGWARLLHNTHATLQPLLKSLGDLLDRAKVVAGAGPAASDSIGSGPPATTAGTERKGMRSIAPPVAAAAAEFELVEADPLHADFSWDAAASMPAWTAWRQTAQLDTTLTVNRHDDRQVTLWRIDQNDRSRRNVAPSGKRVPRRSLVVMQRGDGVDVIPLPVPWPLNSEIPPAALEILREAGTAESGRTTLTVRDEFVGSMIMYLSNGQIADAAAVLAEANRDGLIEDLVSEKLDNPFAACAAAYVGFATLPPGETPPWTNWLGNLMDQFEWLPDGAVIRAAYLQKTAKVRTDLDTSLDVFKTAYRRGIPFYTAGLQHLMNGLYTFSGSDAEAKAMHDKVAALACRVDPNRAFTQITITATRQT
jgi:hypothetical protein